MDRVIHEDLLETLSSPASPTEWRTGFSPRQYLREYFVSKSDSMRRLTELRQKGWNSREMDVLFKKKQESSSGTSAFRWVLIYAEIAAELHAATGAFTQPGKGILPMRVLDICMAPGGFTKFILDQNSEATACGITLPRTKKGYDVAIPFGPRNPRVDILFSDVTACGLEFGLTSEECTKFMQENSRLERRRPFLGHSFDLVICDGQMPESAERTANEGNHKQPDEDNWGRSKATSLMYAQLILGMQRIKQGGTFVILLHKAENWWSLQVIKAFSEFASVQLFKPARRYAAKSSFYLIAKDVQPRSDAAQNAIDDWKICWRWATLKDNPRYPYIPFRADPEDLEAFLRVHGEAIVKLAEPIWKIQADGLERVLVRPVPRKATSRGANGAK